MNIEEFFKILLEETKTNKQVAHYHGFLKDSSLFEARKVYFCQRLEYLKNQIDDPDMFIWDCGCGYGTLSIFLAINNIRVHGTTIGEHYCEGIAKRYEYWKKYGDLSSFSVSFESLFDSPPQLNLYDAIVIQDTLHHLEPLQQALGILHNSLVNNGKLIVMEPNGKNIVHRIKQFLRRGNNRVIEIYDKYLQKKILYGDENFKSLQEWEKEFKNQNLVIEPNIEHLKLFLPFIYNNYDIDKLRKIEKYLAAKSEFLRNYFFFGINFVARKSTSESGNSLKHIANTTSR